MTGAAAHLEAALRVIAQAQQIPGFQLTVVRASGDVWGHSYGVTEASGASPVTSRTRFPLASVTKVATALVIHSEVGAGRLSLASGLGALLPDVSWSDPRAKGVTLQQLLSHTAGLGDFDPIAWADDEATGDDALLNSVRLFAEQPLAGPPGEQYLYSNAGYDVAGLALARAVGTSFEEAVASTLLGPLGMTQSSFYPHAQPLSPAAVGHVGDGLGGVVPYRGSIGSRSHAPCGTLACTGDDVARWMAALLNVDGELSRSFAGLTTPIAPTGRADGTVSCLGMRRRVRHGSFVFEHGGWDPGFRCALAVVPERGIAACLLTNHHWSSPLMMECCLDALQDRPVVVTEEVLKQLRVPPAAGRGAG